MATEARMLDWTPFGLEQISARPICSPRLREIGIQILHGNGLDPVYTPDVYGFLMGLKALVVAMAAGNDEFLDSCQADTYLEAQEVVVRFSCFMEVALLPFVPKAAIAERQTKYPSQVKISGLDGWCEIVGILAKAYEYIADDCDEDQQTALWRRRDELAGAFQGNQLLEAASATYRLLRGAICLATNVVLIEDLSPDAADLIAVHLFEVISDHLGLVPSPIMAQVRCRFENGY